MGDPLPWTLVESHNIFAVWGHCRLFRPPLLNQSLHIFSKGVAPSLSPMVQPKCILSKV